MQRTNWAQRPEPKTEIHHTFDSAPTARRGRQCKLRHGGTEKIKSNTNPKPQLRGHKGTEDAEKYNEREKRDSSCVENNLTQFPSGSLLCGEPEGLTNTTTAFVLGEARFVSGYG
jgi:hypothetical protein